MKSFKTRITEFWQAFCEHEDAFIKMFEDTQAHGQEIVDQMHTLLEIAFEESYFEMGRNKDGKCELIITPAGNHLQLLLTQYCVAQAPKQLWERWNFYSTKPAETRFAFAVHMKDMNISGDDVTIFPQIENQKINIRVYSEKLNTLEENDAYHFLFVLLDSYISEFYTMKYIGGIEFLKQPVSNGVLLKDFKAYIDDVIMEEKWMEIQDASASYTAYEARPIEENPWLREDVYFGITSQMQVIQMLYGKDASLVEQMNKNGIVLGFLYYENSRIETDDMLDYREQIDAEILAKGKEAGICENIGAATGLYSSYLDYIVYDIDGFLAIIKEVMENANTSEYGFQRFILEETPLLHVDASASHLPS